MKRSFCIGAAALLFCAGCATKNEEEAKSQDAEKQAAFSEHTDATVAAGKMLAQCYMAAYVEAVQKDDFNTLEKVLPKEGSRRKMRANFIAQQKWIAEKLGVLARAQYLDSFRQGAVCDYVWKLSFEKKTQENAAVPVEFLYRVRVMVVRDAPEIVMVGFILR